MTLSIDGTDIGQIIEIAAWVGSIVTMLVVGLIVYLMVRPPRHLRGRRTVREIDPADTELLEREADLMEKRLEAIVRSLAERNERPAIGGGDREQALEPADQGRDAGRKE